MRQINEKLFCALASEKALAKEWLSKEDEEAWKYLNKNTNSPGKTSTTKE